MRPQRKRAAVRTEAAAGAPLPLASEALLLLLLPLVRVLALLPAGP